MEGVLGNYSLFHWAIMIAVSAVWVAPLWKLLERSGRKGAWALLGVIPFIALCILWVVAFGEPKSPKEAAGPGSEPA